MPSCVNFFEKARHRVSRLRRRHPDSPRAAALGLALWSLKKAVAGNVTGDVCRLSPASGPALVVKALVRGGLGDNLISAAFLHGLASLADAPVRLEVHTSAPTDVFRSLVFGHEEFALVRSLREAPAGPCDLVVDITRMARFPGMNEARLARLAPRLLAFVEKNEAFRRENPEFFSDEGERIGMDLADLTGAFRQGQADPSGILDLRGGNFTLFCEKDPDAVRRTFGLPEGFITLARHSAFGRARAPLHGACFRHGPGRVRRALFRRRRRGLQRGRGTRLHSGIRLRRRSRRAFLPGELLKPRRRKRPLHGHGLRPHVHGKNPPRMRLDSLRSAGSGHTLQRGRVPAPRRTPLMNRALDLDPAAFLRLDECRDCFACASSVPSALVLGSPPQGDPPLLSVVIPTCSRPRFFRAALESVLGQKDPGVPWEIVVTDNTPAPEESVTPAQAAAGEYSCARLRFYRNGENLGPGHNWNRGVELARGVWTTFLHDDDLLRPDALRSIAGIISRHAHLEKPLGYIHARRIEFSDDFDARLAERHDRPFDQELTRTGALIRGWSQTAVPSCGTTILKKAYVEAGGVDYSFGGTADAVLGYRIMKRYTVLLSGRTLGGYRWADNATLNRETLLSLALSDYLFADYRYRLSPGGRLFGALFRRVQHNRNLEGKIRLARLAGIPLAERDFDFITPYRPSSRALDALYTLVLNAYHQLEKTGRHPLPPDA